MKTFKPMLAIDASDHLDTIKYPKYASYKLDGIRCIFHPKLGMITRSLKQIPNKQLQEKFKFMIDKSKELNRIFDGELYDHDLTFQDITRACMTQDFEDGKTIKKISKDHPGQECFSYIDKLMEIQFCCFDTLSLDITETFNTRKSVYMGTPSDAKYNLVMQIIVNSKEEVLDMFKRAVDDGFEGLILRDPGSPYKFGRSSLNEEYLLKVKLYETFDAEIFDVVQATAVNSDVEKTKNKLGGSVTSRKKNDRHLIGKACAFKVDYGNHELKVVIAMSDKEKEEIWENREMYIGRMIEYKGMLVGSKDVPRHPVMIRFREDRD